MTFSSVFRAALCLAVLFCAAPAQAADQKPQTPDAKTVPAPVQTTPAVRSYKDVPDEYLREADNFYRQCEATPKINFYYNCECMGTRYLDKRIEGGPLTSESSILLSLNNECRDATNAAGHEYMRCMESAAGTLPVGTSPENFCSCMANSFAKMFEKSTAQPNSKTFVALKTRATIYCRDPGLARKLYPDLIIPK